MSDTPIIQAILYQPARTAMQSGQAPRAWVLEWRAAEGNFSDPLMGWNGTTQTQRQVRLKFDTLEQALNYAKDHRVSYDLILPKPDVFRPKLYANNFRFQRISAW